MADWEFGVEGFRDPEAVRRRNVNAIEGAELARAARAHLAAQGFACGEVFPEDFGWVFDVVGPEGRYLCAFSLEAGDGGAMVGHAGVTRHRSLGERLRGRGREAGNEAVSQAVEGFLRGHPDIRDLADNSA